MAQTLQSFIAGRWIGREPAQALRSAVDGKPVASTHAEPIDFGGSGRSMPARSACPACWRSTSSSARSGSRRLPGS